MSLREEDIVREALIKLTDACGWQGTNKEVLAFQECIDTIMAIIDKIDSAERL